MRKNLRPWQGFTLVELIVVITILGILAAFAVPRYVNLQREAELAAVKGVYGAAMSATRFNFAERRLDVTGRAAIVDGASLLNTLDDQTRSSWFAPGGPYIWNESSTYGIEVVAAETNTAPAQLAIVDPDVNRIFP